MPRLPALLVAASMLVLGACASTTMRSKANLLDEALRGYAATIRWGDVAQAQAFIEPKRLAERPPSTLDLERFRQVRITGYTVQSTQPVGEDEVRQVVQVDLVNVNTQVARSVVDHEVWKYDEAAGRWWLTTGLPDISRRE